jgi:hypothetical protein
MALGRRLSPLTLVPAERQRLLEWTRRLKTAQSLALRARIVLLCAEGRSNTEVGRRAQVTLATGGSGDSVSFFCASRGYSMNPVPVPGDTLESQPHAATHWSTRSLAQATGFAVHRQSARHRRPLPQPA